MEHRRHRGQLKLALVTHQRNFLCGRLCLGRARGPEQRAERLQVRSAEHVPGRLSNHGRVKAQEAHRRAVQRADPSRGVDGDDAGGNPLENGLDVAAPALHFDVFVFQVNRRSLQPATALPYFARHAVERLDQRPKFIVAHSRAIDAIVQVSGFDFACGRRQPFHRLRDALGEIEPHPGGAHQDHERHHQEEREVHAGQGPPQHAELAVVFVGVGDAPGARGELAGEIVARHHHGGRLTIRPVTGHRGRPYQLTPRAQRFRRRRPHLACRGVLSHPIGDRALVALRQIRRRHIHVGDHAGRSAARQHAIHLDHSHPALRHLGKDEVAHRADIRPVDVQSAQRPRNARCVIGHPHLPIVVVIAGDVFRRGQYFLDRRVEPPVHAVADQLAAHDQHQHGRNDRHAQQNRHQLCAESRERKGFAALDDQLDDVAGKHEGEAEQNRDVGRP